MPTCTIDGKKVEFTPGENLVDIAKRVGIHIPVFCYHEGLSVVAQCRMCTVSIEKMPKLQTACSTPATDGMVVNTQSEAAKKNRQSVMEFLLVNHPLDCPVCDKSGECDLQDFSYEHGSSYMRSTEERRTYLDLDMGPVIQKNMNRCIHCTRCIRFGQEVAGMREMVALQRGNHTEITTLDGRPLETNYAGNYADVCPTGSLTLKDFRFNKRVWFLQKTPTVCEACSRGCNIELHKDKNTVFRCLPRKNMQVNKTWICDEGRFHFHSLASEKRITEPWTGSKSTTWSDALDHAKDAAGGNKSGGMMILIGTDLTLEEARQIQEFAQTQFPKAQIAHFGTPGITSSKEDADEDQILRRKSKTANLHGLEKLGIKGVDALPSGVQHAVVFRGGRAVLPDLKKVSAVGVGVFFEDETKLFQVILPGPGFSEKNGTVMNSQGMEQKYQQAVAPPGECKMISEILMMWMNGLRVA